MVQKSAYTDTEAHANECVLPSSGAYNEANIFLGLIEYELNSLLGASHLVDYISVHIRFDLERYLLIVCKIPHRFINGIEKMGLLTFLFKYLARTTTKIRFNCYEKLVKYLLTDFAEYL